MSKQYGLIKPEKSKVIIRPSIFNESSDSDDESKRPTGISALKKKEKTAQNKVLEEDPTVYQYDEVYDEIQSQRKEAKLARKDLDKKPKYINKLLEAADRRKRENERRIEREVQKERELEGDIYKDKESFVTSSYKQKLEEMKELEEKEKREAYLETIGDVKKQGDLSGFYRHLYAQQVNFDEEEVKKEAREQKETPEETKMEEKIPEPTESKRKRKYRKRETSKSSDEASDKEASSKLEHLPSNLDADSDFSIDSESDSETESSSKKVKIEKDSPQPKQTEELVENVEVKKEENGKDENEENGDGNKIDEEDIKKEKKEKKKKEKKPKVDIWKKRTVGDLFDDAVKRFYERKAERIGPF